jgi:dihydropteroate synthase
LSPLPDPVLTVTRDLEATVHRARHNGTELNQIVVDPGLGFGKRREENPQIIARLRTMAQLELPIMVGPSRKMFLAQSTETLTSYATAAAVTVSIINGAHMVRVHDVAEMKAAAKIADEILGQSAPVA